MELQQIKNIDILTVAERLGIPGQGRKRMCYQGHDKATASLMFPKNGNYFICHGCGIKGSVIDLVMNYLNIEFIAAVEWLTGEKMESKKDYQQMEKPIAKSIMDYQDIYWLFLNCCEKQGAVEYLGSRGISKQTVIDSEIYCISPDGVHRIEQRMLDGKPSEFIKGIPEERLIKSGLFYSTSDRPRLIFQNHRLIFPYFNQDFTVIQGIQGKRIDNIERAGKFICLSGFSLPLWNYPPTDTSIPVVICEGVIDGLSCIELGVGYPIGVAGVNSKAIFDPQVINNLGKFDVIVAGDNDIAGREFNLKLTKEFNRVHEVMLKAISLGNAKDLNDFLVSQKSRQK